MSGLGKSYEVPRQVRVSVGNAVGSLIEAPSLSLHASQAACHRIG
jgi:hypothetical protein